MFESLPLARWIDQHRHLLKPPVGNKCIVDGDFIVMIVGGPNQRSDWHVEAGPEFFFQIEGEMVLKVMDADGPREVPIRAGELYYLAPNIPHSPQRMADSIGLVIERKRRPGELDALEWYCPECNHRLYREEFALAEIENQFPPVFARFYASLALRTCGQCGHLHPTPNAKA